MKREEILSIATDIFLKEGYGRASMDQIHARLGGSKRTLYNHFPSKAALFEAIIATVSDQVSASLRPPLGASDLRGTLLRMGTDYLSVLLSPKGLALYRAVVSEAPHFPELGRAFFESGPARASRHLAGYFRDQKAAGKLFIDDPQVAAQHFLGAVRGDIHLSAILCAQEPTKSRISASVVRAVDMFLSGAMREIDLP